jgi:hypothetical protein
VPGYDDYDDDDGDQQVLLLSSPPPGHKLLTHHYNSLDKLTDDLNNWGTQALFGIKKSRTNNHIKDFGYTRVDFTYLRDKLQQSKSIAIQSSSTTKISCS